MNDLSRRMFFRYMAVKVADQASLTVTAAVKGAWKLESQFGLKDAVPCSCCGKSFEPACGESVCPSCDSERKQELLIQQIP